MKKMIVLSVSLLFVGLICLFFRDRENVVVFSCSEDCEIGSYPGQFVEIRFVNQFILPILYERTNSFEELQLKEIQSLSDDLKLDAMSNLGSWRMDSCIVYYNKYGIIEDIYILGNSGNYFHSVYQNVSVESKRRLKVRDLLIPSASR